MPMPSALYKTDCRVPGFAGYTEATKEELAEGVSGSSESKYHEYTTETLRTAPLSRVFGSEADAGNPNITFQQPIGQGIIGQTVEQEFIISQRRVQGDKLATTITADKEELQRVVEGLRTSKNPWQRAVLGLPGSEKRFTGRGRYQLQITNL